MVVDFKNHADPAMKPVVDFLLISLSGLQSMLHICCESKCSNFNVVIGLEGGVMSGQKDNQGLSHPPAPQLTPRLQQSPAVSIHHLTPTPPFASSVFVN